MMYAIELDYNGEIRYLKYFIDDETDWESTEFLQHCGTFVNGQSVLRRVNYELPCTARLLKVRRLIEVVE